VCFNSKNKRTKDLKIRREEFYKKEEKSTKNKRTKALKIRYTKKINDENDSHLLMERGGEFYGRFSFRVRPVSFWKRKAL
jgi:hypothetical protein